MLFRRFLDHNGAGVLPMFGLLAIPAVGLIGASVDYSRASAARAGLQSAVDSTALSMAKTAATLSTADLSNQACTYFLGQIKTSHYFVQPPDTCTGGAASSQGSGTSPSTNSGLAAVPSMNVSYSAAGGVVMSASSSVPTLFMRLPLVGIQSIPIAVNTTAKWGDRLRVALVLDNTGSMSQGSPTSKISALKTASTNLLQQLQSAGTNPEDVYVSIIPFVKDVNVGSGNYSQSWLDFTDWDAANGTCSNKNYTSQSGCTNAKAKWTPNDHSTWNGCVTDRGTETAPGIAAGNDESVNAPAVGDVTTLYPAEQYSSCPSAAAMGLSYDWTSMNTLVGKMTANGNTNQAIGVQLGWMSLVGGGPFTAPALDPNYKYQQYIIILSDGLNTQDRWYGTSNTCGQGNTLLTQRPLMCMDQREAQLCDNIKSAGIKIFAVQVDTDKEGTSAVLQYCAGSRPGVADATMFFLLTSPSQIISAFNTIGSDMAKLHLAK